jgi:hypothetical protein
MLASARVRRHRQIPVIQQAAAAATGGELEVLLRELGP